MNPMEDPAQRLALRQAITDAIVETDAILWRKGVLDSPAARIPGGRIAIGIFTTTLRRTLRGLSLSSLTRPAAWQSPGVPNWGGFWVYGAGSNMGKGWSAEMLRTLMQTIEEGRKDGFGRLGDDPAQIIGALRQQVCLAEESAAQARQINAKADAIVRDLVALEHELSEEGACYV